jgi:hypothetical protein
MAEVAGATAEVFSGKVRFAIGKRHQFQGPKYPDRAAVITITSGRWQYDAISLSRFFGGGGKDQRPGSGARG